MGGGVAGVLLLLLLRLRPMIWWTASFSLPLLSI